MEERNVFQVMRAVAFAERAHRRQTRKYTGEAYIAHPIEVALTLAAIPGMEIETIVAAVLHDVEEDCGVDNEVITRVFGKKVGKLVSEVTERSRKDEGNREHRKKIDLEWYAQGSAGAHNIKIADMISNTACIMIEDPNFADIYMKEKRQLLNALTKGHPALIERARGQIEQWELTKQLVNNI